MMTDDIDLLYLAANTKNYSVRKKCPSQREHLNADVATLYDFRVPRSKDSSKALAHTRSIGK